MMAGRELDALIAEKVMGWEPVMGKAITKRDYPDITDDELDKDRWHQRKAWFLGVERKACDECGNMPEFSTSIEAAWQVFCRFTSRFLWYDDATDTWHCHVDSTRRVMQDCRFHAVSEDDTGAEAICLAALKAMGVTVEGQ